MNVFQVQVEVIQKRQKEKKAMMNAVKKYQKGWLLSFIFPFPQNQSFSFSQRIWGKLQGQSHMHLGFMVGWLHNVMRLHWVDACKHFLLVLTTYMHFDYWLLVAIGWKICLYSTYFKPTFFFMLYDLQIFFKVWPTNWTSWMETKSPLQELTRKIKRQMWPKKGKILRVPTSSIGSSAT